MCVAPQAVTHDGRFDLTIYVGGDVATGSNDPIQLLFRPRITLRPYDTGVPGTFLCSAATPPGAGVHGMGGYGAAQRALASLTRRADRRVDP